MSVLIKGMKMPENCVECGVEWCERWKGLIIAGMSIAKSRPSNCPFVEVPTPHGRLIDADEIPFVQSEDGCTDDYAYRYDINELPTVIEAEEVKE